MEDHCVRSEGAKNIMVEKTKGTEEGTTDTMSQEEGARNIMAEKTKGTEEGAKDIMTEIRRDKTDVLLLLQAATCKRATGGGGPDE